MRAIITIMLAVFLLASFGFSQDQTKLEEKLTDILAYEDGKEYLKGYMQPFVTAFGTGMAGAMYHRASAKGFPRFDAGISAVYISVPDEGLKFESPIDGSDVPTVFGKDKEGSALVSGVDLTTVLVPQLHVNLGLFANFELTGRYLGYNFEEFGDLTLLGFGVKYGFSDLIPLFPIDMSAQAMYHTFSVGDFLDAGTFGMNLQVSKDIPILPIGFYGGIGFESTSMTIKTADIPGNSADVGDVSIDGKNGMRMTVGVSFGLPFINFHADYNIGEYNSIGFGAMVVL